MSLGTQIQHKPQRCGHETLHSNPKYETIELTLVQLRHKRRYGGDESKQESDR